MTTYNATYSPDDNKLRLYASSRLDAETYTRVKAAGFSWAPKQELFVAPMWTPEREDLLLELAGEIGDEDTSLTERAEQRAERFEEYSDKRAADSASAHAAVSRIADGIPLGQPILVGHHSERHARKDAERIENGMRRAVKMWETSKYWTARAAGALAHAAHKERPDVRARRIKKLESERRKVVKNLERSRLMLKLWRDPLAHIKRKDPTANPATFRDVALYLLSENYELWGKVDRNEVTPEDAQARMIAAHEKYTAEGSPANRWLAHYDNRLAYEKAMLGETDYIEPPKTPTKAVLPLLNYAGEISYRNPYHAGELVTVEAHHMTAAEFAAIGKDYTGTRISADGSHRVRTAYTRVNGQRSLVAVFLTDKKAHPRPETGADTPEQAEVDRRAREGTRRLNEDVARAREVAAHNREVVRNHGREDAPPTPTAPALLDRATVDAMRDSLKAGVTVAVVPDLFPTPSALAARMVELADIMPDSRVLEPSAGTGNILDAIQRRAAASQGVEVVCVEQNYNLAENLRRAVVDVWCADFLTLNGELGQFDRIVMNPPFSHGADLKHIAHARSHLKPGGRIVALCANGPRQQAAFANDPSAVYEPLPAGTFSEAGTNVNVALVTIEG